jgi:hypothetical protein
MGALKAVTGQNLGFGFPGLGAGFQPFHPMKGPMTTQTLQDIIGKEPLHWRGDRGGLENFNPAFQGLQGDDVSLTAPEMQQFEDFLATISYPPNPYRNFDNTLPTNLPLPGHFTTGRFAPAGQPLPNGNAVAGLAAYRPPTFLDGGNLACATCHTLPTGMGTDYTVSGIALQPIPVGSSGEHHRMLVSVDGTTNLSTKVPQLRNLYEKTGFNTTQQLNTAGLACYAADRSIQSSRVGPCSTSRAIRWSRTHTFILSLSAGAAARLDNAINQEPPGVASKDTHAAVGRQQTLAAAPAPTESALITSMLSLADAKRSA